ncbi:hypothetical protein ABPG75_003139 [Micractinium tetrahymenae]
MPLQRRAEDASRQLTAAARALQGCTSHAAALLHREHQLHEGRMPSGSDQRVPLSRLLCCLGMCDGASAALAKSFLPDASSDEERFLSVFVAGTVASQVEKELASLQRCLEAEPGPDLRGAEELAEAVLQRLLSATVSLALDVPVYAAEGAEKAPSADEGRTALAAYGPAVVGLLEELQARAQKYTDELSAHQRAALPLLARLLDAPAGPQGMQSVLDRLLAATPAQRAVLGRAVLSRRFELAAERLQVAGFSLGARQVSALPPPFQSMAATARAGHSVRAAHALSQFLTQAAIVAATLPPEDPDQPAVASFLVGQLLPARTQYLHRTLGGRLLPEEVATALRLCGSAASAVFSNRTPWAQLRSDLRREAEAEAALLGGLQAAHLSRVQSMPAGGAAAQDKMDELVQDVEADLARLLAPSPTGEGAGTPTTALDLSSLRSSGDCHAASVVVRTVCERALLRRDAAAADELVAASHVLHLAGG